MKTKKKLISILLTISMMLTLFPFAAFAEEAEAPVAAKEQAQEQTNPAAKVAEVNGTQYDTLSAAIDAVEDGGTVTLKQNVQLDSSITLNKNFVFDLGGNTLSLKKGEKDTTIFIDESVVLTLKNGKITSDASTNTACLILKKNASLNAEKVAINATCAGILTTNKDGNATINFNGSIDSQDVGIWLQGPKNNLTIDGATINSKYFGVYQNGSAGGSVITLKNSTIVDTLADGAGVYVSNNKTNSNDQNQGFQTLTIENCNITGATGVEVKYTNVTIDDKSTLTATGKAVSTIPNNNGSTSSGFALAITHNGKDTSKDNAAGTVDIKGGTFNGYVGVQEPSADQTTAAQVIISGGTFTNDITGFLAYGKGQAPDGTVGTLSKDNAVAMIGDTPYATLQAAVAAVAEGQTITLQRDVTIPAGPQNNMVLDDKNVTINGQGHKITRAFDQVPNGDGYGNYEAVFNVNADGVTIKDVVFDGLVGGTKDEAAIYINANGTTVEGCIFNGGKDSGIAGIITPSNVGQNLNIKDNTFNNLKYGMYFNAISDATISGNKIDGTQYTGIFVTGSNVTVKDNVLTNIGTADGNFDKMFYTGIYTTGATADKPNIVTGNKVTLAEGNTKGEADNADNPVVIGNTTYKTLAEAVAAVKDGQTITLKADNAEKVTVARKVMFTLTKENNVKFTGSITATNGYVLSQNGDIYNFYYPSATTDKYSVIVKKTDNGSVSVSPKRAEAGDKVTINVDPDKGYVVDAVVVTDKDGDKITVTKKSATKYTFTMPKSRVDVKVTFKAEQTEPEQPSEMPFVDVVKDAWYYPAVEYVYNNELMNGTNGGLTFEPNVNLNRAMMAAVLYNMEGGPACDKSGLFSDVADGMWYTEAINWAASNNIVSGMPDGTYAPNQALTREQMASVLYRYAEYKGIKTDARADLGKFTDGSTTSAWAQDVVQWAVAEKLINGVGTELQPKGTATRAQVATVLMNYCENVAK